MYKRFKSAVFNRQRQKWEKKRKNGRRSFLIYRGVLKWGGIMFVLTSLTNALTRNKQFDWLFEVSMLIACPFAGYVWARCVWYVNERRYRHAMMQQDSVKRS
jgi:hypothetical protein